MPYFGQDSRTGRPIPRCPRGRELMQTNATELDIAYMRQCLALARQARASGDHPVGALVERAGVVLGRGAESTRRLRDVTAHAEIEALRAACAAAGVLDLAGATMYTTVEPCYMGSTAIRQLGLARVVIGRPYPAAGGVTSRYPVLCDASFAHWSAPPLVLMGVLREECDALFERK